MTKEVIFAVCVVIVLVLLWYAYGKYTKSEGFTETIITTQQNLQLFMGSITQYTGYRKWRSLSPATRNELSRLAYLDKSYFTCFAVHTKYLSSCPPNDALNRFVKIDLPVGFGIPSKLPTTGYWAETQLVSMATSGYVKA